VNRIFKCGDAKVKLPLVGNVTVVTLAVLPVALFVVVMWGTHQSSAFAWVGQNLMVYLTCSKLPKFTI
jgi:hypothetical protein